MRAAADFALCIPEEQFHTGLMMLMAGVKGGEAKSKWPDPDAYEKVKDALTGLRKIIDEDIDPLLVEPSELSRAADIGRMFLRVALELLSAEGRVAENEAQIPRLHNFTPINRQSVVVNDGRRLL